jgi:hypothetical protein
LQTQWQELRILQLSGQETAGLVTELGNAFLLHLPVVIVVAIHEAGALTESPA